MLDKNCIGGEFLSFSFRHGIYEIRKRNNTLKSNFTKKFKKRHYSEGCYNESCYDYRNQLKLVV